MKTFELSLWYLLVGIQQCQPASIGIFIHDSKTTENLCLTAEGNAPVFDKKMILVNAGTRDKSKCCTYPHFEYVANNELKFTDATSLCLSARGSNNLGSQVFVRNAPCSLKVIIEDSLIKQTGTTNLCVLSGGGKDIKNDKCSDMTHRKVTAVPCGGSPATMLPTTTNSSPPTSNSSPPTSNSSPPTTKSSTTNKMKTSLSTTQPCPRYPGFPCFKNGPVNIEIPQLRREEDILETVIAISSPSNAGQRLLGSTIKTVVTYSVTLCHLECASLSNCASFNYEINAVGEQIRCELNHATSTMYEHLMKKDNGFIYYEMIR